MRWPCVPTKIPHAVQLEKASMLQRRSRAAKIIKKKKKKTTSLNKLSVALSPSLFLLFSSNLLQRDLQLHRFIETALIKVTNHLFITLSFWKSFVKSVPRTQHAVAFLLSHWWLLLRLTRGSFSPTWPVYKGSVLGTLLSPSQASIYLIQPHGSQRPHTNM